MHLIHCLLHAALGAIQFLAYVFPITLVRRLDDRLRVWGDRVSHADSLRERQDTLANLFYRLCVFRLHRDKTVGDHCPQQEGDARALGKIRSFVAANVLLPVHRAQFIQRPKNFVRQRHHNVFHSCGQLFNIDPLWGLGAICAQGKATENTYA